MSGTSRIVVGGDTTPAAGAALLFAVEEASRAEGCSVVVVHAFDTAGRADLALERDLGRARRDARYRTQSWVVEVLGDSNVSVPVMVHTPDASVEDALADAALSARMVVVGEPQNGRRRELSATLRERCSCPVVTVGAGRKAALVEAPLVEAPLLESPPVETVESARTPLSLVPGRPAVGPASGRVVAS